MNALLGVILNGVKDLLNPQILRHEVYPEPFHYGEILRSAQNDSRRVPQNDSYL